MTPIVTLIQSDLYELTPENLRFSPFVWSGFSFFNQVHAIWRWKTRLDFLNHPDRLGQLLQKVEGHFLFNSTSFMRVVAVILLVATKYRECLEEQEKIYQTSQRWGEILRGRFIKNITIDWEIPQTTTHQFSNCLSPHTIHWWKTAGQSCAERLYQLGVCTLKLVEHTFKLSMLIMDIVDAMMWEPEAVNDAALDGVINTGKCLSAIIENKGLLLTRVDENKKIITKLLHYSPLSYEQFHFGVSKIIGGIEYGHKCYQQMSDGQTRVLQVFTNVLKIMANGVMVTTGLSHLRPVSFSDALLPDPLTR